MDKFYWETQDRRHARSRRFLLNRIGTFRYQFVLAVLFAVVIPVFVRWGFSLDGWLLAEQMNTMVGSTAAIFIGMLMLRQVEIMPQTRGEHYIIPTQLAAFAIVLAVFFFGRLNYNRFLIPISFVVSVAWLFVVYVVATRRRLPHFLVVPFGDIGNLLTIPDARWTVLTRPSLDGVECDGIVADLRSDLDRDWESFVANCAMQGHRVFHAKQIREALTGRVAIEHLSENTLGSLNPQSTYSRVKHVLDWVAALVVAVVGAPFLLAIAAAIRIDSPGPVFYVQRRIGYRGQPFGCIKFRTMYHQPEGSDPRQDAITRDHDPRITGVGMILRRTRLDEVPQIFNILRGEMSWIGPRPEAAALAQWYEEELPFYRYRHIVRPGITGWAQVNQGHVAEIDHVLEKLHYDFYYIKNFSPWLDLLIVFRTMLTVITGFGAR